jgi:hypothetical protein
MEVGAPEFRIAEPFKGFVLTPQVFFNLAPGTWTGGSTAPAIRV